MTRKILAGALVATALAVHGAVLAGVAMVPGDDGPRPLDAAAAADPTTTTTAAPAPRPVAPATTTSTTTPAPPAANLPEGVYAVNVISVDVGRRTLAVDTLRYSGDGFADLAYARDHPGEEPYDGDVYLKNDDPTLLHLAVGAGAPLTIVGETRDDRGRHAVDLAGLARVPDDRLFWMTIDDGEVTALDQQFMD